MAAAAGNPFGSAVGNPFGAPAAAAPAAAAPAYTPGNPFADSSAPLMVRSPSGSSVASAATTATTPTATDDAPAFAAHLEVKIGVLSKKGEVPDVLGRATWKSRFVNVSKGRLSYHETEDEAVRRANPIKNNVIYLSGYAAVPIPDGFELVPVRSAQTRVWCFRCASTTDRDEWLKVLHYHGCYSESDRRAAAAIAERRGKAT